MSEVDNLQWEFVACSWGRIALAELGSVKAYVVGMDDGSAYWHLRHGSGVIDQGKHEFEPDAFERCIKDCASVLMFVAGPVPA